MARLYNAGKATAPFSRPVGRADKSNRAYGIYIVLLGKPATEVAGYWQRSLRDQPASAHTFVKARRPHRQPLTDHWQLVSPPTHPPNHSPSYTKAANSAA